MGELFTIKEIAEKLKVTEQCIRDWIREGKLPALKIGGVVRIEESTLHRQRWQGKRGGVRYGIP
jgi:excisionase family DNA binding protein